MASGKRASQILSGPYFKLIKIIILFMLNSQFALKRSHGHHILPSLKKFRRQNLKYNTSINPTYKDALILKISLYVFQYQLSLTPIKLYHALEYHRNHTISNPNSTIHLERPTQSLSNPLAIISPSL